MANKVGKSMKTCKYLNHKKKLQFLSLALCSKYVTMIVIVDSDSWKLWSFKMFVLTVRVGSV